MVLDLELMVWGRSLMYEKSDGPNMGNRGTLCFVMLCVEYV